MEVIYSRWSFLGDLAAHGLKPGPYNLPDWEENLAWCRPSVAHMAWDTAPLVRRALRWSANIARGKRDLRQTLIKAEFLECGTIGPASAKR